VATAPSVSSSFCTGHNSTPLLPSECLEALRFPTGGGGTCSEPLPAQEATLSTLPQTWACAVAVLYVGSLAAAYAWAGHDKEAKQAVAELRKLDPSFTLQSVAGTHPSDDPTYRAQSARIFEGLRKAGLPEE
jgi:hypothetical protein